MLTRKKSTDAKWRKLNPDKVLGYTIKKRVADFTVKQYRVMEKRQRGLCAICRKKPKGRLHVDHDHRTGKVRGLLCQQCNHGLGLFYDSIKSLRTAIMYLYG